MKMLIERYKRIRKKKLLRKEYTKPYAFIGIGQHSLNNLYPILDYLNVDIKYIGAKSKTTIKSINSLFKSTVGTSDLDEILNDSEINGVFVSASPNAHFKLAKKIISRNKNLFIEKPPCSNMDELNELIRLESEHKTQVLVGIQRRYSPVFNILKTKSKNAKYYTLKYRTGAYPEGDELLDLFIHPLDALFYLFGEGVIENINTIKGKGVITYFAHLKHTNGVAGSIELSTDYSWNVGQDILRMNTQKGEYVTNNTSKLIFREKPKVLFNIPIEKLKTFHANQKVIYEQNSFLPQKEHNQLYYSGYFNEVNEFMKICENKNGTNHSTLKSLTPVYSAIDTLRKFRH